jgi:hypothetical protein
MAGTKDHVVCCLCGMNQIMLQQRKGMLEYKKWTEDDEFIQIRDYTGGRGSGFPKVGQMTLHDAVTAGNSDYDEIINRMKEQLLVVLGAFYKEGIITSAEVRRVVP